MCEFMVQHKISVLNNVLQRNFIVELIWVKIKVPVCLSGLQNTGGFMKSLP